jgi:DNA invertase Pin-like site-specific DNA recombinase
MATFLYARTSTSEQTIAHQRTQAEAMGFRFDDVVCDDGVSGVTTRLSERAGGKRLFDLLRGGDTLVVRWIDRLGRNYEDVTTNLRTFMQRGVIVRTVINDMVFDGATKDPMQQAMRDALIGFMAAQAQAQAEAAKEAQRAGIAHAKSNGRKYLGRKPSYSAEDVSRVLGLLGEGRTPSAISKELGLSRQAIYRIKEDPSGAFATAQAWEA